MPFIDQHARENLDFEIPGHRCYAAYKQMMIAWHKEPRWTTADAICASRGDLTNRLKAKYQSPYVTEYEWAIAVELAWQVFFQLHVMPYELAKIAENGDVTGEI